MNTEKSKPENRLSLGSDGGSRLLVSPESFAEVVRGCPVPVVIAGGSKQTDAQTMKMIEGAMKAGAAGLSIGRNAFQHKKPEAFVRSACEIVHHGRSAEQALKMLREKNNKHENIHRGRGTGRSYCRPLSCSNS